MTKIRVLQLASFSGNIGDNANESGTRKHLRKNFTPYQLEFTDLEIREFFWGRRKYDNKFADYVNSFDLFLFGGGNFFEMWVDHSSNNTSVDIDIPILERIQTPTVFYGLGLDDGMGTSQEGIAKFQKWLEYVIKKPNFKLSLRNDGALGNATKYFSGEILKHFHQIPDGGFFLDTQPQNHPEIYDHSEKVIGMNLAGDMPEVRFPLDEEGSIGEDQYLDELATMFNQLFDEHPTYQLVLFPHIYKDIAIISKFIAKLKDWHARKNVSIAPYLLGDEGMSYIFDGYGKCDVLLGTRFHANVCAIAKGVPTIGLYNYKQIKNLYSELGWEEDYVRVNVGGFSVELIKKIRIAIENRTSIEDRYVHKLRELGDTLDKFHNHIKDWLDK